MKTKFTILTGALSLILGLLSCSKNQDNTMREHADLLYRRICSTSVAYMDSIKTAKDSMAVESLYERFEERLVKINYESIPDTDYAISEDQNDTIYIYLDSIRRVRIHKLEDLGRKYTELPDTLVSADSISVSQEEHLTSGAVKVKKKSVSH